MPRITDTPVEIGPFFTGDHLPTIFVEAVWNTGGALDLAGWPSASFVVTRLRGSAVVMSGTSGGGQIVYHVVSDGELEITLPNAFTEPGWYKLRLTLTDGGGKQQSGQQLIWEVVDR